MMIETSRNGKSYLSLNDLSHLNAVMQGLQEPLPKIFDTEITLPLPPSRFTRNFLSIFSSNAHVTTSTTTLRQHFLQKINGNLGNVIFINNVLNTLAAAGDGENPARFFKRICSETAAICNAVYEQWLHDPDAQADDALYLPASVGTQQKIHISVENVLVMLNAQVVEDEQSSEVEIPQARPI